MTALHHVNVVVPPGRTEDVVGFYALLGLRRLVKPVRGVAASGAWFEVPGGGQVHVSERDGARHPEQHFCLVVPDLTAVVTALQAAGHPWSEKPTITGSPRGMTADPCGNAVELTAP